MSPGDEEPEKSIDARNGDEMSENEQAVVEKGSKGRDVKFWALLRRHLYEVLCMVLFGVALLFFWQSVAYLMQRDYPGSVILAGVGLSVAHLGGLMARLALADRS
jgi:hypothetical protein